MSLFNNYTKKKIFGSNILVFDGDIRDSLTGKVVNTIARIGHTSKDIQVAHRFLKLSPSRQLFLITMLNQFLKIYGRNDLNYYEKYIVADALAFRKMMREYPNTKNKPFLSFFIREISVGPKKLSLHRINYLKNKVIL